MDKWARIVSRDGQQQAAVTTRGASYRVTIWTRTPENPAVYGALAGQWREHTEPKSYPSLKAAHARAVEIIAARDERAA